MVRSAVRQVTPPATPSPTPSTEFPEIPLDANVTPTAAPGSLQWVEAATIAIGNKEVEHFGQQTLNIQLIPPNTRGEVNVVIRYPGKTREFWDGPAMFPDGSIGGIFLILDPGEVGSAIATVVVTRKVDGAELAQASFEVLPFNPSRIRLEVKMSTRCNPCQQGELMGVILVIRPMTDDELLRKQFLNMLWDLRILKVAEFDPPNLLEDSVEEETTSKLLRLNSSGELEVGTLVPAWEWANPGKVDVTVTISSFDNRSTGEGAEYFTPAQVKGSIQIIERK